MTTPETSRTAQTSSGVTSLDTRLVNLYSSLHNLPEGLPDHPEAYPFASNFILEPDDVEFYGSEQGALNHRLELIFGSRSAGNAIEFRGRGRSLEAIVYILRKYISGDDGENLLLWKWVEDLTNSAAEISPTCNRTTPRSLRPTVWFADLTLAAQILTPNYDEVQNEGTNFDEPNETGDESAPIGSRNYFEVECSEGVFLASKLLSDTLYDSPNVVHKMTRPLESPSQIEPPHKRQRVDIDSIVF